MLKATGPTVPGEQWDEAAGRTPLCVGQNPDYRVSTGGPVGSCSSLSGSRALDLDTAGLLMGSQESILSGGRKLEVAQILQRPYLITLCDAGISRGITTDIVIHKFLSEHWISEELIGISELCRTREQSLGMWWICQRLLKYQGLRNAEILFLVLMKNSVQAFTKRKESFEGGSSSFH